MKITTREIRTDDAPVINDLTAQLGYMLTLSETENAIRDVLSGKENCTFVAVADGKVIGWIHGFKAVRIECKPFIEIGGLVVDKDHRGKGAGKKLIEKIINWSKNENISVLKVRSNTKRLETHQIYCNLGFSEMKEQKVFEMKL